MIDGLRGGEMKRERSLWCNITLICLILCNIYMYIRIMCIGNSMSPCHSACINVEFLNKYSVKGSHIQIHPRVIRRLNSMDSYVHTYTYIYLVLTYYQLHDYEIYWTYMKILVAHVDLGEYIRISIYKSKYHLLFGYWKSISKDFFFLLHFVYT